MKRMNRKAELPLYAVMETAIAIVIMLGLFFGIAYAVGSPTRIEQQRIAKETGLMIDTLYATPAESEVQVGIIGRHDGYSMEVKDGAVIVWTGDTVADAGLIKRQSYPYTAHAIYPALSEKFVFNELDIFKDRRGIDLQDLPSDRGVLVTSADIDSRRIYVTGDGTLVTVRNALQAAIKMESGASRDATATENDLVIILKVGPLQVTYPSQDPETKQQGKKLAEIITQELGKDAKLSGPEASTSAVPTAIISIPESAPNPAADIVPAVTRALRRYYA